MRNYRTRIKLRSITEKPATCFNQWLFLLVLYFTFNCLECSLDPLLLIGNAPFSKPKSHQDVKVIVDNEYKYAGDGLNKVTMTYYLY